MGWFDGNQLHTYIRNQIEEMFYFSATRKTTPNDRLDLEPAQVNEHRKLEYN